MLTDGICFGEILTWHFPPRRARQH